jgi:hypothetical protein
MTAYSSRDDYQFFLDNQEKFHKEYPGKFLVIKNKEILGVYEDQVEAYTETTKEHEPGTFIIQNSSPSSTDVQVFHSRVVSVK